MRTGTGLPLGSVTAVAVTTGALALTLVLLVGGWNRWRARRTGRALTLLTATAAGVLAAAVAVNSWFGFYPTVGSLTGDGATAAGPAAPVRDTIAGRSRDTVLHTGSGAVVPVHLPPGYDSPDAAALTYPVIAWTGRSDPSDAADAAVTAGRIPAAVLLLLPPGHPPDAGALRRAAAAGHLRLRDERAAWAVAGDGHAGCPAGWGGAAVVAGAGCGAAPGPGPAPAAVLDVTGTATGTSEDRAPPGGIPSGRAVTVDRLTVSAGAAPDGATAAELDWLGRHLPGPVAAGDRNTLPGADEYVVGAGTTDAGGPRGGV
ncbi:hypothetical protein [Pseudonocardia phyllosphaerae]|uniref:hypothetical protein n=1 Tax=Pseudonocardia phyllosphaerae TaxID=3390502 RepID=UPI00397C191A